MEFGESSNIGSTHNSNCNIEDELTTFFSSPTMMKMLEVRVIQILDRVFMPTFENSIRKVVRHELELAEKFLIVEKGNPEKDIQAPKPRNMKLKFLTKVSGPVLTGVEIKGEGDNAIELALVDENTGEIVDSGLEASAKVEIVVLKGDFGDDDGGNWTAEEFSRNVVQEWEGKKSLLAETVCVKLNKGICSIDKIRFKHSAIYMRKGKFRLGARIVDAFHSIQVKEARTESFSVKDGRQQYYEKHDPPSLSDGVHQLKNVGRSSKKRLQGENVETVEDFLILLLKDHERLKCVLNLKPKMLKETICHARRCIINERIYSYIDFQEKEGVVFNIVGEVLGLVLEFQYLPMHLICESDKATARRLLVSACEHWDHVVPFDDEMSLMQYLSQMSSSENRLKSPSGEVASTNYAVESLRTNDGRCHTPFQGNGSSITPARIASEISLNECGSTSISNLEFSNFPIYSPSDQDPWIHQDYFQSEEFGFEFDASASNVFRQSSFRRRAAASTDVQVLKKQKVV